MPALPAEVNDGRGEEIAPNQGSNQGPVNSGMSTAQQDDGSGDTRPEATSVMSMAASPNANTGDAMGKLPAGAKSGMAATSVKDDAGNMRGEAHSQEGSQQTSRQGGQSKQQQAAFTLQVSSRVLHSSLLLEVGVFDAGALTVLLLRTKCSQQSL
jgi:hypothetical protein